MGDNVEMRIEAINGESVRLSFNAPREVMILRGELLKREERANER